MPYPAHPSIHPSLPFLTIAGAAAGLLLLSACSDSGSVDHRGSAAYPLEIPAGFPDPELEEGLELTEATVKLGRFLFYDRRMSVNEEMSCADCHLQSKAFTDGKVTSEGTLGDTHPRNAMSMTNVVYNASQNWANPITLTLHSQALVPMFGETPIELGWADNDVEILARFTADPAYPEMFAAAFPEDENPVTADNVAMAVAAFGAVMISGNSDFDKERYQGIAGSMSESAKRGEDLFFSERLECFHCHGGFNFASAVSHDGLVFEQVEFHNNGLYNIGGTGNYPQGNQGLFEITHAEEDRGKFKAPTLRNIELTAPYMHDGSIATLEEVVDHYARGGRLIESGPFAGDGAKNPLKSSLLASFQMTQQDREDLVAFLKSLTDWAFICNEELSDPFGNIEPHSDCLQ